MELSKVFIYALLLPLIATLSSGLFRTVLLYIHAIGLTCVVYNTLLAARPNIGQKKDNQSKEMYGMRHVLLNIRFPPDTLWFNMGLWAPETTVYSEACEEVMSRVVQNSNIQQGESVLDVGFGCGDSCKYLADKIQCKVTGISNELSQVEAAQEVLSPKQKERIELLCGSADDLNSLIQPSSKKFDHIVSIDSAYHFNTRWNFFKSAYKQLKDQGGTLGLFDFALHPAYAKTLQTSQPKLLLFKAVCKLFQVPATNLLATPDEYKQQLHNAGFEEVQIHTVEPNKVFGGISCHIDRQSLKAMKYGINVGLTDRAFLSASAYIFSLLATHEWITPIFASAKKNQTS
ncbi:S-adenosyl-L-methionine-dependent methyltransferase [Sporodiniella umbellata]|nr:S-adenosyl-L-methionine-dependent methyltransferase [Sporodiniella umbellata]